MNKLYKHKFIPHNSIAEDTILGVMLICPQVIEIVKKIIKKEYFFLEKNKTIYVHLLEIIKKSPNNTTNYIYILQRNKLLLKIGGINRIIQLMKQGQIFISSSKNSGYIKKIIFMLHEDYIKRLIIQYSYNIINICHIQKINSQTICRQAVSQIYLIEQQIHLNSKQKFLNIKDLISKKLIEIKYQNLYLDNDQSRKYIKWGFIEIDKIIPNLQQGNLIIIAGRPSVGKTSFAINIAYKVFFNQNHSILIFSLEMSNFELFNKLLSIGLNTNINNTNIDKLNQQQWNNISKICNKLLNNTIYINDKSNTDIKYIHEIAKSTKKKRKILI